MSGAMRRIGEYLGLLEDTGRYEDEYVEDYAYAEGTQARQGASRGGAVRYVEDTGPVAVRPSRREVREARAAAQSAAVTDLDERRRTSGGVALAPAPTTLGEGSRITTLQPRTYNDARTVGENYRDGTPVIMNLTDMDDADAKRLVDFAAGLIFASHGTIERITNRVFLLSPHNVSVAAEEKVRLAEGGFFNQS